MIRIVLFRLALATAFSAAAYGPASGQPVNGQGEWNGSVGFDQLVLNYITQRNLPGATVAVTRGGRLVLSKGYGYARLSSQTPMLPTHVTYIGSTSKMLTAIGAMQLIEDMKLGLHDRVYGTGKPLMGSVPGSSPGVVTSGNAVLKDPGDYFSAMVTGVGNLNPAFPPADNPSAGIPPGPPVGFLIQVYNALINQVLDRASAVEVKHLLSHTSGIIGSGDTGAAAREFGKEGKEEELTYKELHLAVLMALRRVREDADVLKDLNDGSLFVDEDDEDYTGKVVTLPPFGFSPAAKRSYSNHAFGLLGHIIAERSGMEYEQFIRQRVLAPLGLDDKILRGGTQTHRYAQPYAKEDHPFLVDVWTAQERGYPLSGLGLATGGWATTAQDLVRLMCGLDKDTINPILKDGSIASMETIAYPGASSTQPLGWDRREGNQLQKNGVLPEGGMSQIIKFLPGDISKDEINIAFATNIDHIPPGLINFLVSLAKIVANEAIPEHYDLFDAKYPCVKKVVSGTVELRDNSPIAPKCPRPAEVAASIRTNTAGPFPYVLACTGSGREWKGTVTAHQTGPATFIGVVVRPIQIAKQEDIVCAVRRGEQFGFADVLATDKRHYPCAVIGVAMPPEPPHPPPGPPSKVKQPEPPPAPRFVCLGGKVMGPKARPVCGCAPGQVARQVAPNRFQCMVQLVCEGGRVVDRGRSSAPACECPSGLTAQRIAPVQRVSQPIRVPSTAAKGEEPDRYRCVRVAALPGTPPASKSTPEGRPASKTAPGGPPRIACTGGIVRANRCVCPSGMSLQNGVCRSTAAKVRAPVRSAR